MNAFTSAEPAPAYDPKTFDHAAFHELEPGVPDHQRYDGWTPEKQKRFLIALSRGHSVTRACAIVGMSRQTAYALRGSARGAAFALGWNAALLRARDALADELMDRAFNGVRDTVTRDDGSIVTRHRHDNQLAWKMLARLDRHADTGCNDANAVAARLAAADFDELLDLVARDAAPARAGLFLAARMGAQGVEADDGLAPIRTLARADRWLRTHGGDGDAGGVAALDPADRAGWTGEQWALAEAAGLVVLAPEPSAVAADEAPDDTPDMCQFRQPVAHPSIWWCDEAQDWRTRFPPPPDFDGIEDGTPGEPDYERALSEEEEVAMEALESAERAPVIAAGHADRLRWLADCRAAAARAAPAPDRPDTPNTPAPGTPAPGPTADAPAGKPRKPSARPAATPVPDATAPAGPPMPADPPPRD